MVYYIRVMKMASRYKFSEEEIREIEQARKENKNKRAEARLKVLELRAKGAKSSDIAKVTGFHPASVTRLVAKYRDRWKCKNLTSLQLCSSLVSEVTADRWIK